LTLAPQLPPELERNEARVLIEKYKRALFSPQSASFRLKQELRKLLTGMFSSLHSCSCVDLYVGVRTGSKDVIDLNFGHGVNELRFTGGDSAEVIILQTVTPDSSGSFREQLRDAVREMGHTQSSTEQADKPPSTQPPERKQHIVTYELMMKLIEQVLLSCGYYNIR
jgi:hypothetical protein